MILFGSLLSKNLIPKYINGGIYILVFGDVFIKWTDFVENESEKSLPMRLFPRLYNATDAQRQNYTLPI